MKFELNPTMVVTKEEFATLDNAMKLCRDMDAATTASLDYDDYEEEQPSGCDLCPKRWTCSKLATECVFTIAHKTLFEIINMAVIK